MERIMTKTLYWSPSAAIPPWRRAAAAILRSASGLLAHWASGLVSRPARPICELPRLEFHAESGAPEGALYLDGQLVGWVPGVNRL
jgi:hypothetical protein